MEVDAERDKENKEGSKEMNKFGLSEDIKKMLDSPKRIIANSKPNKNMQHELQDLNRLDLIVKLNEEDAAEKL
jgi:hypothetical protein